MHCSCFTKYQIWSYWQPGGCLHLVSGHVGTAVVVFTIPDWCLENWDLIFDILCLEKTVLCLENMCLVFGVWFLETGLWNLDERAGRLDVLCVPNGRLDNTFTHCVLTPTHQGQKYHIYESIERIVCHGDHCMMRIWTLSDIVVKKLTFLKRRWLFCSINGTHGIHLFWCLIREPWSYLDKFLSEICACAKKTRHQMRVN